MENKKNLKRYSIEYKCKCIAFYLDILAVNPATSYTSTSKRLTGSRTKKKYLIQKIRDHAPD